MNATVHHGETEPVGDVDTDIDTNTVIASISFTITIYPFHLSTAPLTRKDFLTKSGNSPQ